LIFSFLKARRRKNLRAKPITEQERSLAKQSLWQYSLLSSTRQEELIRWSRIFLNEKYFEGCNRFQMNDEVRWTIAMSAAICLPPNTNWYYEKTASILIYPDAYVAEVRPSVFSQYEVVGEFARQGQTVYRGPVILNWNALAEGAASPNGGHQLAIHEFAHQLDMINGPQADGIPPLEEDVDHKKWVDMMRRELEFAQQMRAEGKRVYINDYGLSSAHEFFAVASEYYFQTPHELSEFHPGVYQRLKQFYRFDMRDVVK
jgi:MtfA peptidase